ncbi:MULTISPECIES: hypothetical protein [Alteromonas]|jgi:hypothetical protein|uniref:DUF2489 domain-containing protein n=1 Tax=Alteromonas stellipolaris TaxID=233316 RepID=A0AAW7Z3B6_9ALTE|nr:MULTISPECIES: hypothetical protein [Alteromonas]AMJ89030.1 hypothetical protein AV940_00210 [Alteromonas sp. Mac2]AMJ72757.1 hypothetical protein AVL57_01425 [Alteromonas stellipolaris]AMJ85144.1 hypothetical protein AV939_00210 [Alteromonas sp. Mac1]AMJ92880.1 hypothetical protein AVL56_00205 [Alteromonas stellipolaris]ANB20594.1 hypothetical protein A6K25_04415 [Alteromonas stellipolaris]
MIFAFGIIGLLVLFLIYLALRVQTLQRELTLTRSSAKQNGNKVNHAYKNLVLVTDALEKAYAARIESAYKSRLISQQQHTALMPLMLNFSSIVMACCEKGATLEEALDSALSSTEVSQSDVRDVIKEMPGPIRMAWSKNSADGFIAACQLITSSVGGNTKKSPASSDASTA